MARKVNKMRLLIVGLFLTLHLVYGLVATTNKQTPTLFTKRATLPPLDIIPIKIDWENDDLPTQPSRDYSARLPIVYTNDLSSAEEWAKTNLPQGDSIDQPIMLGWDMESSPRLPWKEHTYNSGTYFGPATIQLSTAQSALVIQIAQDGFGPIHEGGLPQFLHDILINPRIIPVGVGIDDDMVELYRWCLEHGDDCAGPTWASRSGPVLNRFDMGGIGSNRPGSTKGLARLVAGILGVVLPKSKKLARTHWSREPPLSKQEVGYAARDAWAGAAVLERLYELDSDRFDPATIVKQLEDQIDDINMPLRSIQQISNRKILRKVVKTEWNELKQTTDPETGEDKPPWTDEQRERFEELTVEMKELAPTPPLCFEITESLGIDVP